METVDIRSVTPGRRLARPVFGQDGVLIFPPGLVLTPEHLELLLQRGVNALVLLPEGQAGGTPAVGRTRAPARQSAYPAPGHFGDKTTQALPDNGESLEEKVRNAVAKRFSLLGTSEESIKILFNLAVERQLKIVRDKQGRLPTSLTGLIDPPKCVCPPRVSMGRLLETSHRMGTLPLIFHRLIEMINKPVVNSEELAKIISTDPAMTAKLLKLVNSPFFGLAYKIDTISRAVIIVGTKQLVMLSLGATVVSAFKGLSASHVNVQAYWLHSISCAAACRLLCGVNNVKSPEGFFVAGLLHDIARLLIYTQLPSHAQYILSESSSRGVPMHAIEREALGYTHEELGAELLSVWNCSADLVQRVFKHHQVLPENCSVEDVILPAANMISQALGYGSSGEILLPPLPGFALDKAGLYSSNILSFCNDLDTHVLSLMSMFSGG
ncbi:MAG: HDOD domain-containing protein [Desulfovibrio sp.]|jgi:HD-like signal output (HDOD) protein|nr:HDOD domain-containing protein [Desulfovibrio sp.]